MPTTTTITVASAAMNIVKAMGKWMKWSEAINGLPNGWVPLDLLDMTEEEINASLEASIIDVYDDQGCAIVWFLEQDELIIFARASAQISINRD